MKSYKVLDWRRVPKQGTIDHQDALKVLLFFICCVFCFANVLLLTSDEFYFYFFMVVMAINVDHMRILHCFGACGWWNLNITIYEKVFNWCEVKFLDLSWSLFLHLFSLLFQVGWGVFVVVLLTISSKMKVCEGWMP